MLDNIKANQKGGSNADKGVYKVLLVDDNQTCHMVLNFSLKYNDKYELLSAYNGQEAIDLLKEHASNIDIIMLDINLTDMYGYELYGLIKKIDGASNIPVVFQSALPNQDKMLYSILGEEVKTITKPYLRKDIIDMLDSFFP